MSERDNTERDVFLSALLGITWHCQYQTSNNCMCGGGDYYDAPQKHQNTDFSTWPGFGKLWTWAKEQEWWGKFFFEHSLSLYNPHKVWGKSQVETMIDPDTFANAIHEHLK